jgi:hypothetical protein
VNKLDYLKAIRDQLDILIQTHDKAGDEMRQVTMGRIATYLQQENLILESITAEFLVHSSKTI